MKHQIDSSELGINLHARQESQLFRWLLACLLFGKPIQQEIAKRAYETLTSAGITSIKKLEKTDWHTLVALLDAAHYVRYDFSTATKLLNVASELRTKYGSVTQLLKQSTGTHDLTLRLTSFNGIGPVTAQIFVREVADIWCTPEFPPDYDAARRAAAILSTHAYEAYIIGGAVRDLWLNQTPKDFDIVTNATPKQIMAIPEFHASTYKDTAQAYGVTRVRFVLNTHAIELEIATFRKDLEASKGRKQTKVAFATLEDDVLRRDFTINALALDPVSGGIIDFVDGVEDLEQQCVRFIGQPMERIQEDPLRILRAIRFKNRLEFSYDPGTAAAIQTAVKDNYTERIATERIREELSEILLHPSRSNGLKDLYSFGILQRVLPEVAAGKGVLQPPQYHAEGDVWQHEQLILTYLPDSPSRRLVWAALLHDIGKGPTSIKPHKENSRIRFDRHYAVGAEMAKAILQRLHFSRKDTRDITWMIYHHMSIDDLPNMRPSSQQRMLGHPAFEDLLELHRADAAASWRPGQERHGKPRFRTIEKLWHEYQRKEPHKRQPSLKHDVGIDGKWLLQTFPAHFTSKSGPLIGHVLQDLDTWYRDEGVTDKLKYRRKVETLLKAYAENDIERKV